MAGHHGSCDQAMRCFLPAADSELINQYQSDREMRFKKALSMLSKSSPYAVSTAGENIEPEFQMIKDYLYVETDIELAFKEKLDNISSNEIIFLCGSSGDGKSEILTRCKEEYGERVDFHLDATHSFKPDATAVETLDDIFTEFNGSKRPLVVGVNVGMLGNYEKEGNSTHADIRSAIKGFLNGDALNGNYTFISFESFPKFKIIEGKVSSEFFASLLNKIVVDDSRNPFRDLFNEAMLREKDKHLISNYLLLRERLVQKTIVELLLCARIKKDQFITARMLLDFIYCVLTGPDYLFDNVFGGGDNEILTVIADFDPSIVRNKKLDLFVIHRTLKFEDSSYSEFIKQLAVKFKVDGDLPPSSMIRCFYLLKNSNLECNYHYEFRDSFNEQSLELYKSIWQLHKDFTGDAEGKAKLKPFYNEVVLLSINKYANRNAPHLSKDEFYISSHGKCELAAEVDIAISYPLIKSDLLKDISEFYLHINVNDEQLASVPINVNLVSMMMDIVNGFRPNKHDKNSVVLLDDLVNKITQHANSSKVLFLHRKGGRIKLKDNPDGDIRVSGL